MDPISVLIVDDHPLVRVGIRYVLDEHPRIQVVAEAGTGVEALEKVGSLLPRVVLMDISMPDMNGLEAARRIKERFPQVCVVMVTVHDDEKSVTEAILAGAAGYLLKSTACEEVCRVVEAVAGGDVTIKASLFEKALKTVCAPPSRSGGSSAPLHWNGASPAAPPPDPCRLKPHGASRPGMEDTGLTVREVSVLRLVVLGMSNKEIGAELTISIWTAKKHVESILAKLQVSDRTGAAVKAIHLGLLQPMGA